MFLGSFIPINPIIRNIQRSAAFTQPCRISRYVVQFTKTGAPRLPFSCILMHADDWKLSGSLEEALPHLSTWGGGSPVLDPVRTYCFCEETRRTRQPSTCFVNSFRVAFSCRILFLFTCFCLWVNTSFLICHLRSSISLLIFKISLSTSLLEGMLCLVTLKTSKKVTRQGVIFNLPKP